MYAAINTKIKALEGKFLSREQYENILNCDDYISALTYLRDSTSYGEMLNNVEIKDVHRGQLEYILKRYYMTKFQSIMHYFNGTYRKFFKVYFERFEIEDLKVILRKKFKNQYHLEKCLLITLGNPITKINFESLISKKSISEVIEALKDTKYYDHLVQAQANLKEGLFGMEMALDFVYFDETRSYAKKLNREDSEIIEKINGTYCDLLNIQWILRAKKYYNLSSEELFNYTIRSSKRNHVEEIKRLCNSRDIEDAYNLLQHSLYASVFLKSKDNDIFMEREINSYLQHMFKVYKIQNSLNISAVISYLELFLIEIRNIITIIENKRYKMSSEETLKYITVI